MFRRLAVGLSLLLVSSGGLANAASSDNNIPVQLQAIQQQLTAIQSALGTQGSGLSSLQSQLTSLQTTVNALSTKLTSVQSQLANVGKPRKFYLTQDNTFDGSSAGGACASGYHMADLYEILDPSSLEYNTSLGLLGNGSGAPSFFIGWIRSASVGEDDIPGERSCGNFSTNDKNVTGTVVHLEYDWTSGARAISPWVGETKSCDTKVFVWCMQDG